MAGLTFDFSAPLNFPRTLAYIGRYENDNRRAVYGGCYYPVLTDGAGLFLVEVRSAGKRSVAVSMVQGRVTSKRERLIEKFVRRTFGSDEDLLRFYRFARDIPELNRLTKCFRGLRVVGLPTLWESLAWSIIGQQVSVASAFAVRSRLVNTAGSWLEWNGARFEGFPPTSSILAMTPAAMKKAGVSRQKVEYLRATAREIETGRLSESELEAQSGEEVRRRLLELKGIGPWSVEYSMMRVFGDPDACPLEDIGLRNAIGREMGIGHQATVEETGRITERWKPFRGHGTFYFWQTLLKSSRR